MNDKYLITKQKLVTELTDEQVFQLQGITLVVVMSTLYFWFNFIFAKKNKDLSKALKKLDPKNRDWDVRVSPIVGFNACTMGTKTLFIGRDLLDVLERDEAIAILLHEMSHSKTFDVIAQQSVYLPLAYLALTVKDKALGDFTKGKLNLTNAIKVLVISLSAALIPAILSKALEYKSDSYAVKLGYGKALASALNKMRVHVNISTYKNCKRSPGKKILCNILLRLDELFSSHPDIGKRILVILKKEEPNLKIAKVTDLPKYIKNNASYLLKPKKRIADVKDLKVKTDWVSFPFLRVQGVITITKEFIEFKQNPNQKTKRQIPDKSFKFYWFKDNFKISSITDMHDVSVTHIVIEQKSKKFLVFLNNTGNGQIYSKIEELKKYFMVTNLSNYEKIRGKFTMRIKSGTDLYRRLLQKTQN